MLHTPLLLVFRATVVKELQAIVSMAYLLFCNAPLNG